MPCSLCWRCEWMGRQTSPGIHRIEKHQRGVFHGIQRDLSEVCTSDHYIQPGRSTSRPTEETEVLVVDTKH